MLTRPIVAHVGPAQTPGFPPPPFAGPEPGPAWTEEPSEERASEDQESSPEPDAVWTDERSDEGAESRREDGAYQGPVPRE